MQVTISNRILSMFGFNNLREMISDNKKIESLILQGENYEYFPINERSVEKLDKFLDKLPVREKVEFVEATRVKFQSVRQAKLFF
jgi:phage-related protein